VARFVRGKEDHEEDTTTVHHDGSGATFGRRDGLGGSRRSDGCEYGSAHPRGNHAPYTPTGVDPTANIKAKFSEAMKARSINTKTFYLLQGHFTAANPPSNCTTGTPLVTAACPAAITATVRYNADTKTAILDPTNPLVANTEYTAVIEGFGDGDHVAVKDRGGTPMARDYIFYFTTGGGGRGPL
jgi:Bacterial Ig-like domain